MQTQSRGIGNWYQDAVNWHQELLYTNPICHSKKILHVNFAVEAMLNEFIGNRENVYHYHVNH